MRPLDRCKAITHSNRITSPVGEEPVIRESLHRCFLARGHESAHMMDPREAPQHWHEWDGPPDRAKAGVNRKDNIGEVVCFERGCADVGCHPIVTHLVIVLDVAFERATRR